MKADKLELTLLFDIYGSLLTDKQRECFDYHYNQDDSLAEIAELMGISRQGVHDSLTRAEAALLRFEEVAGCLARERQLSNKVRALLDLCDEMPEATAKKVRELCADLV